MTIGLLLDTCAVLDLGGRRLGRGGAWDRFRVVRAARQAWISSVVGMEIAQKVGVGKLLLPLPPAAWLGSVVSGFGLRVRPLGMSAALDAYDLPEPFHRDPADRLMVATARALHIPLLTSDRLILAYAAAGHVDVVGY